MGATDSLFTGPALKGNRNRNDWDNFEGTKSKIASIERRESKVIVRLYESHCRCNDLSLKPVENRRRKWTSTLFLAALFRHRMDLSFHSKIRCKRVRKRLLRHTNKPPAEIFTLHKIPWCFMILFRTQALLLLLSKCRNQWVYRSARYARISEINDRKLKCRKFYRQRTKKSMKTWPTPDWPWQIVALDIFYLERCSYLMIVHEYRNFFGRDFVKTQTVSGLISDQRAVFQWHGVSFHFYRTRFQQFSEHDILDTSPGDTAGDVARDTKMMVKRQNLG